MIGQLARLLLRVFYRSFSIRNPERMPERGPLVVAANHHGSLIDPLVLLAMSDRPLRPLAKAPLFHYPILRFFLRWVRAVPVYRPQDGQVRPGSNAEVYRTSAEVLAAGGALMIFPEGLSKAKPVLSTLKPGAARIALAAEERSRWSAGTALLPVAIHFEHAHDYRRGTVIAEIGVPIAVSEYRETWQRDPEAAVAELTQRLTAALREMLVEGESSEELHLLRTAMRCWLRERGEAPDTAREVVLARDFARAHRRLQAAAPRELEELRELTAVYARTLATFRLSGGELDVRYHPLAILRFVAFDGLGLLALTPLGIAGLIASYLPFQVASILAGRMSEEEDSWASLQLGVAAAVFPVYWFIAAVIAAAVWGRAAFFLALFGLPALATVAWVFADHWARLRHRARSFVLLAGGAALARHLRGNRRAIHDHVQRLVAIMTEEARTAWHPSDPLV